MRYLLIAVTAVAAWSQQLDLSKLDALAAKARESATVDLDADKLKLASGLIASEGAARDAAQHISQMKGVFVRTFEFENTGAYTQADLDSVRNQLNAPNWNRILEVKDKDELVEVWFYMEAGKSGGMAVITAEPKELVVVNIVGPIDIQSLAKMGNALGVADALKRLQEPKKPAK